MTEDIRARVSIARARQSARRKRSTLLFLRDLLVIFVVAVLISFLIKTFLIRSFYIPSQSMEQTLVQDDRIIVNELVPDLAPIEHGDIVVFKDPGGWLPARVETEQPPVVASSTGSSRSSGSRRPTRTTTSSSASSACPATTSCAATSSAR